MILEGTRRTVPRVKYVEELAAEASLRNIESVM